MGCCFSKAIRMYFSACIYEHDTRYTEHFRTRVTIENKKNTCKSYQYFMNVLRWELTLLQQQQHWCECVLNIVNIRSVNSFTSTRTWVCLFWCVCFFMLFHFSSRTFQILNTWILHEVKEIFMGYFSFAGSCHYNIRWNFVPLFSFSMIFCNALKRYAMF